MHVGGSMDEWGDLVPEDVTFGEVRYPPGGNFGPRVQPFLQLVFLHSGWMTVWIDEAPRRAEAGTVALLLPGHREHFAFAETCETHHSWLHASIPSLSAAAHKSLTALPWPIPLSMSANDALRQALLLRSSALPTAPLLRRAIGAQLIWQYIGEASLIRTGHAVGLHPAIEQARQFMAAHLDWPCSVATIARAAAVSPAHLTRLFKQQLNTTPNEYLWQRRIEYGVELLQHTGLAVGEVAERCGFQTSYHFSRRIRQATGRTPSEIRNEKG